MRSLPGLTDSRRSGWFGNMRPGLDSPDAVLRGTLGVSCSPKPSICGAECPPKGAGSCGKRSARGVDGRVLRSGTFVNRVRSGRKQP